MLVPIWGNFEVDLATTLKNSETLILNTPITRKHKNQGPGDPKIDQQLSENRPKKRS